MTPNYKKIRAFLAVASIVLFFSMAIYAWSNWEELSSTRDIEFNDIVKAAVQLKIEQSRGMFQLSLLILGAMWTLMLAKPSEASIALSDVPELTMFCVVNLFLLTSCWYHIKYVENITQILAIAGAIKVSPSIPDILRSGMNSPYQFQQWFLISGSFVGAIAFFSAHKFK